MNLLSSISLNQDNNKKKKKPVMKFFFFKNESGLLSCQDWIMEMELWILPHDGRIYINGMEMIPLIQSTAPSVELAFNTQMMKRCASLRDGMIHLRGNSLMDVETALFYLIVAFISWSVPVTYEMIPRSIITVFFDDENGTLVAGSMEIHVEESNPTKVCPVLFH